MTHRTLVIGSRIQSVPADGNERQLVIDRLALVMEVSCYAAAFLILANAVLVRLAALL